MRGLLRRQLARIQFVYALTCVDDLFMSSDLIQRLWPELLDPWSVLCCLWIQLRLFVSVLIHFDDQSATSIEAAFDCSDHPIRVALLPGINVLAA